MADFGADRALVASQSSQQVVSTKGFDHGEGAAPTLDAFAKRWGVSVDLAPLARQEQAFNDMMAAALARDDAAWAEAKARFEVKGTVR
jgi:hypothetical protein